MYSAWSEGKSHRCKTSGLKILVRNVKRETTKRNRRMAKLALKLGSEVIVQRRLNHHEL